MVRDNFPEVLKTTVASGQTDSGEIDLGPFACAVAIELPSALTGAVMTIKAANRSGGTFKEVHNSAGAAISAAVAANEIVVLPTELSALRYIKVILPTQAADRDLYIHRKAL